MTICYSYHIIKKKTDSFTKNCFMDYCDARSDLTRVTEQPEGECLFAEVPFGQVSRGKCSASWLASRWPFRNISAAMTETIC